MSNGGVSSGSPSHNLIFAGAHGELPCPKIGTHWLRGKSHPNQAGAKKAWRLRLSNC